MTISAKFIGHHGSVGYSKGRRYILYLENRVVTRWFLFIFTRENYVYIERAEGGGGCIYKSMRTFLENWGNVKVLSMHKLKKVV